MRLGLGLQYSRLSGGGGSGNIDSFIIEVKTDNAGTSNDNQFQFTSAEGDYDVVAKQNGTQVATFNDLSGQETITLPSSGIYVLEVNAKEVSPFTGMRFNNAGDKLKITKVLQWGVFNDSRTRLFLGCANLTQIGNDNDWLNSITNGELLFEKCDLLSLPSSLNLNSLVDARGMFRDNTRLTSLPNVMSLNNLRDGSLMFFNNQLTSLPDVMILNNLDNASNMFTGNIINTERYSQLLIDMEAKNSNTNVDFNAGSSKYNAEGETARNLLIANQNWSFLDGGLA